MKDEIKKRLKELGFDTDNPKPMTFSEQIDFDIRVFGKAFIQLDEINGITRINPLDVKIDDR